MRERKVGRSGGVDSSRSDRSGFHVESFVSGNYVSFQH